MLPTRIIRRLLALLLREALAAQNGSVALGLKRNASYASALSASSLKKGSRASAGVLSCVSASLASLRLVFKALFCVEFLFARGEHEIRAAVLAFQCLVSVHRYTP